MDTQALRNEHSVVLILVSRLGGLSHRVRVKDDAEGARAVILDIDALLHNHLAREDALLYPALRAAPDDATRTLGEACSTEMGGLIGAWASYRSRWTVAAILSDTQRFASVTADIIGALSLRIEMENDILYPALDRLAGAKPRSAA